MPCVIAETIGLSHEGTSHCKCDGFLPEELAGLSMAISSWGNVVRITQPSWAWWTCEVSIEYFLSTCLHGGYGMELIPGWVQLGVYTKCIDRLHDSPGWNHSLAEFQLGPEDPSWNASRDKIFHVNTRCTCPGISEAVFPWIWRNPKILLKRASTLQQHFAMLQVVEETDASFARLGPAYMKAFVPYRVNPGWNLN